MNEPETIDAYAEPAESEPDRDGTGIGFYAAADHAAHCYAAMFDLDAGRDASERERLYLALAGAAHRKLDAGEDLVVFGPNSLFVHEITRDRFLMSPSEWPSSALVITADRTHARAYFGLGDATAYLTEPENGAVIFTDDDAPAAFTEPVPPAVAGEDVAGAKFTIRRGGAPARFVYVMPAAEPGGFVGWKCVVAGAGEPGHLIRNVFGDYRDEATRVAEAFADAERAAVVAEIMAGSPALALATARAMVTIRREARGPDADAERDILSLIDTTREHQDPTAGDA